jgi:membrane-bound serine protease (ClpP class)
LLLKMTARNQELYRITLQDGRVEYVIEDDLPEYLSRHPDIDRDDPSQVIVYRGQDRLLTLTGREATNLSMATGLIEDLDALYRLLEIDPAKVIDLRPGVAEQVATRLSPWAPALAGLAMMFVLFELKTPGVGLWLALGGVSAALFFVSQYYLDMANNVEVVLVLVGAALLAIEVFTMVGGGLLSAVGGLFLLGGLILTFLPNEFEFDLTDKRFLNALGEASVSGLMALGVMTVGIVVFIIVVPRSRLSHRLAVESEISATSGGALEASRKRFVGRRGVSRDPLHPSGLVIIDGEEYTALAEHGAFIESGVSLVVVAVRLGELVVRAEGDGHDVGSEGR